MSILRNCAATATAAPSGNWPTGEEICIRLKSTANHNKGSEKGA